jgi:hypothetical protein
MRWDTVRGFRAGGGSDVLGGGGGGVSLVGGDVNADVSSAVVFGIRMLAFDRRIIEVDAALDTFIKHL